MNVLKMINENDGFTNGTRFLDEENDIINVIHKLLLSSNPSVVLLQPLISLLKWTTLKTLF